MWVSQQITAALYSYTFSILYDSTPIACFYVKFASDIATVDFRQLRPEPPVNDEKGC
jgi:hypothetical protein